MILEREVLYLKVSQRGEYVAPTFSLSVARRTYVTTLLSFRLASSRMYVHQ